MTLQVGDVQISASLDKSSLSSSLNSAKGDVESWASGVESRVGKIGSAIGSALKTGAVAGTVALAGVATAGVKTYMDIESAAADAASKMDLSAIAQKSGQTTEQAFDSVKEHVMGLADELGQLNTNAFDPTQIAQACANLAAGGFDIASASAADLQDVLALATATNYDLSDSASMAMSTMNQFGMTVSDMGHISDVYATAAGKSAASMTDFDYAMQQAGPVAKGVGMSFEELTARVSKLADAGYSGEKSGTALRTAFMALSSPTKTQTETLEKLGLTYADVDPKVHTFSETMDLLLSKGADIYDFGEIYGKEGAAIVYSTAQQNSAVKELTATLTDCDGAAANMAKNMLNTLSGSLDAAMGAASSLAYMIGGKLAPSLRAALDWFSSTGAPAIREFITAISDGDWASVGDQISAGVEAGWAKLKDLGSQLFGWLKGVDWGALGDYITKCISAAWDELKSLGSDLLDALLDVDWGGVGSAMLDAISTAIDSVIDYAGGIYDYFADIDWGGVWDSLVSAWDSAIDALSDVGSTILGYFDDVDWGTVGFKLGKAIRDAIEKLADIGSTVWNYLTSADWSGAGSSITEKIKGGLETLTDTWDSFKAALLAVDWGGAATDVAEKLKAGFKQVTDWATSIIDGIEKDFNDWITGGGPKTLGEDLAKAIVEGAKDLGEWIYEKVEAFWKGISGNGGSLGTTIYTTFKNIFTTLIDWAKLAFTAAYDFVVGFADTILTAGKGTIGAAILEIIGGAMNSAWDGAGAGLIEKAAKWREDAESIFSSEDFDVDVATTYTGAGNPKDLDGSTISVNVQYTSTAGKSLAPSISPEGGASVSAVNDKLLIHLASAPTGSSQWMEATEWAKEMGKAGNTTADFLEIINGMKTAGTKLLPSTIEKLTAAFTEGQDEYNATQKKANEAAIATEKEVSEIKKSSVRDILAEAKTTSSNHLKSLMDFVTEKGTATADAISSAGAAAAEKILIGSQTAANAIALGGQTAANFTTQAGQAVKIGLDSTGREIAVIGQVAQQQFTAAGGDLYSKVVVAGSDLQAKASAAGSSMQSWASLAFSPLLSGATSVSSSLQSAGTSVYGSLTSGASSISSAALSFASTVRSSLSSTYTKYSYSPLYAGSATGHTYATGTKTSGPELAVIGEDGPENPEYVIPTKNKRWDLMYAAMRAYGIPGYAEGTATGTASTEGSEPSGMTATFGITGLASMAKDVKRIINDLKDFFRISWGIIKSEGAKYWKQINTAITTEVTSMRDSVWASLIDIRNTAINSNAEILTSTKTAWEGYLAGITPSLTSVKEGIVSSFSSAATGAKTAIDTMITNSTASLQAFRVKWQEIWTGLVTDMTDAQTKITAGVTAITTELKKISVSVNISSTSSGSTGYSSGSESSGCSSGTCSSSTSGNLVVSNGQANFVYSTCLGTSVLVNALKYTSPNGTVSYINPLTYHSTGGITGYQGSTGYQLPAIFRAKGALEDRGPEHVIVGEEGPELILPAKYTALITAMADAYEASPEDEFTSLFSEKSIVGANNNIIRTSQKASPEDEFAGLFTEKNTVNVNRNIIRQSRKASPEDEFASLFEDSQYTVNPKVSQYANIRAPDMILPARAGTNGELASVTSGSSANIESLLERLLKAVESMGVDVFIDSDEVGKKVMKKIQRKQGASF